VSGEVGQATFDCKFNFQVILLLAQITAIYKSLLTEKNGSSAKTQQRKHKYNKAETTTKYITV